MKKTIIYFAIALLAIQSEAIAQKFEKGTNVINAGIGFGGNYGSFTTSSQSPVYGISYERGIWGVGDTGVVSLGAYLGRKTYNYNNYLINYNWTYTIAGIRGAYHYNGFQIEKLDVYGGVMASYNFLSFSGSGTYNSDLKFTEFLGVRWFFTNNIAAFIEAGYGTAYATLGISFKF